MGNNLLPNQKRARLAIICRYINLTLAAIGLLYNFFIYLFIIKKSESYDYSFDDFERFFNISGYIVGIIAFITFIMWFRRAWFNLHQIIEPLFWGTGWAIWAWFVPFLNLIVPYSIMQEIYKETRELLTRRGASKNVDFPANFLVLWWGLWIVSYIISLISTFFFRDESVLILIFCNVLTISSDWLTIKVIKSYSNIEPLLNVKETNK